ncbi:type VI secretion system ATPase TssH [Zavarzinia compransoris]|uniref:Type VI secretion system ATPase TssH n=1 Tax=Zavarzinia compransoris TaxID=1264899 RepID=A0A317EAK5_9PROT|nr:type VI secretion system ATPase TssH [Zavarzinia compransoris]PWR22333.1 type VI secretion system ATPase TssH [Zavarzinia compransoris]TDP46901.1 type VI secretion system protein VasG [Zavarzinia compransoris]
MAGIDLRALIAKLNETTRRALEAAAGLAMSRSHYDVEIEHWLIKLLEVPDSDLSLLVARFEIDPARLTQALNRVLDKLKTGNSRAPALSAHVATLAREAWTTASLNLGAHQVRSGHLLIALLSNESLIGFARDVSEALAKIPVEVLRKELDVLTAGGAESKASAAAGGGGGGSGAAEGGAPVGSGKTPALDQFTINLTERAKAGKIDPVLGRDAEIRQVVDILTRRRQNNPILTGEAGVGKTAVVEGFALKIAAGDVPPAIQGVEVRTLDLGLLQAGAGVKGEFENRLKQVIEEVKSSATPIIIFIDEAHTLIGAGGQAGQGDAANLLKPALARGELRTIAATTWAEYKKYFEKDAALARRFQVVKVEEPSEPVANAMIRGLVGTLEKHHKVRILDEAVVDAVRLSSRYISGRQLPDKAVSLIDTACARVAMSQNAIPPAIEDRRRLIELSNTEIAILEREALSGGDHADKIASLKTKRDQAAEELKTLEAQWDEERKLVPEIRRLREEIEKLGAAGAETAAGLRDELKAAEDKLTALQGERPLLKPVVDGAAIAEVVAAWTGIPVGRMVANEIQAVMKLEDRLRERVIGQDHALKAIAQAIQTSRAKLTDPRKPIGVFLMAGTSGVGKTETALTLAEVLYGGEQNVTVINMSEFKEEHKVSLLMGSPPGYVGYGEGGVLTEAVRRKPYSVVLLDEMEKAHPGVQDVFYQVFDKGQLKDGEGRDIDFKNTVVIMTSNAGTETITKLCADPDTMPDPEGLADAVKPELLKSFKPAFLGRCNVVTYYPLADDILRQIIQLQIGRIKRRVVDNYGADFSYAPELVEFIAERCKDPASGARNIENILSRGLLPDLSARLLARMADGAPVESVHVGLDGKGGFDFRIG